jgi:hypothetical protein
MTKVFWKKLSKKCAALVPDIRVCSILVITVCDCTGFGFLVPGEIAVAAPIILAALLLDFSLSNKTIIIMNNDRHLRGSAPKGSFREVGSPRLRWTCVGCATQSGLRPCTSHRLCVPRKQYTRGASPVKLWTLPILKRARGPPEPVSGLATCSRSNATAEPPENRRVDGFTGNWGSNNPLPFSFTAGV